MHKEYKHGGCIVRQQPCIIYSLMMRCLIRNQIDAATASTTLVFYANHVYIVGL
ncbi:Uncharacterized protein APZ42_012405 [Daphnia magna]|uniref:Uncharacterized protein n=1 Tax=Daphnia magna TaxID=35525 RepID=A0A0P4ZGZ3_9CRUS|nr:Uncharacterized protein APZ42_012405 [Daphnia magna]